VLEEIFGAYKINLLNEVEINEAEIIAFGDAHANPMQVIYQMLHTGIGYMRPEKLRELAEIYERIDRATSDVAIDQTRLQEPEINPDEISEACDLINKHFDILEVQKLLST